jgi:hypothetical protein
MAETNYERILGISKSIMTIYLKLIESEKTGDTEEYKKNLEYLKLCKEVEDKVYREIGPMELDQIAQDVTSIKGLGDKYYMFGSQNLLPERRMYYHAITELYDNREKREEYISQKRKSQRDSLKWFSCDPYYPYEDAVETLINYIKAVSYYRTLKDIEFDSYMYFTTNPSKEVKMNIAYNDAPYIENILLKDGFQLRDSHIIDELVRFNMPIFEITDSSRKEASNVATIKLEDDINNLLSTIYSKDMPPELRRKRYFIKKLIMNEIKYLPKKNYMALCDSLVYAMQGMDNEDAKNTLIEIASCYNTHSRILEPEKSVL